MRTTGEVAGSRGGGGGVHSSSDTVAAAATAINSAEARLQPPVVQKRRWGGCRSIYWCFGYRKSSKRIGHAILVPEPLAAGSPAIPVPSNAIVLPFIAPPSSPASFLPSDPPSASQSPAGLLSLTSAYSPHGRPSIFAVGPYAYENQLVSPPVFSTFTTEPSTAPITPPPESVHLTRPSSPEVPFAQLLTSSLERRERSNRKFPSSYSDFQHHLPCLGSPGGEIISPGSVVSNSGTSSPFLGKYPVVEFRMGEGSKIWGFEQFPHPRWGSRPNSGLVTPEGTGLSRLASGTTTPYSTGLGSRLSSGCLTPNGVGQLSREGSIPVGTYCHPPMAETNALKHVEAVIDSRVSFELTGEDVTRALANKSLTLCGTLQQFPEESKEGIPPDARETATVTDYCRKLDPKISADEMDYSLQRQRSLRLGSAKDFNFDNRNESVSRNPMVDSEWRASKKAGGKDSNPKSSWSFFPALQPEVL